MKSWIGKLFVGFPLQLQVRWQGIYYNIDHFAPEECAQNPQRYNAKVPADALMLSRVFERADPISGDIYAQDDLIPSIYEYLHCAIDKFLNTHKDILCIESTENTNGLIDMTFFHGEIVENGSSKDATPVIQRVMALQKPDPLEFELGPFACRLIAMTDEPHFCSAVSV